MTLEYTSRYGTVMSAASVIPNQQVKRQSAFASGAAIDLYIAASLLLLHLLTANRYGYFGDELYHMACGEHLAWGYVDQPPLIAVFAWLTRHLFGTSVFKVTTLGHRDIGLEALASCPSWSSKFVANWRRVGGQGFFDALFSAENGRHGAGTYPLHPTETP